MTLGIIGTCYNTGIGNIAWGFAEHFDSKILLYDYKPFAKFPERFKVRRETRRITKEDIDWLLDGIDALLSIETPYDWRIFQIAKQRGIRTFLMPMLEFFHNRPELQYVDTFICPSKPTYDRIRGNKVQVPCEVPVDTERFHPRIVKRARVFLHNAGHGGVFGRNSTLELLRAIPMVKSDVRFVVNSQYPLPEVKDPRLTVNIANYENYWEMYRGEDVYVLAAKFGAAYLGIGEAMACGMPIMFSDIEPFNQYLPKQLLVPPIGFTESSVGKMARFRPEDIAKKIDEIASLDLTEFSEYSLKTAEEWSWKNWQAKYEAIFAGKYQYS